MAVIKKEGNKRVQEIETKLVEELAKKVKSSPKVLLQNQEIREELHRRAVEVAKGEVARKVELEKAAQKARDKAAVEKAMIELGLPVKAVKLTIVNKPLASAKNHDSWHEYLASQSKDLPMLFSNLNTNEEVSACRGIIIGMLLKWKVQPIWTDTNPDLIKAVTIWEERIQNLLSVLNRFFKSIDVDVPPRASKDAFNRVSNVLDHESIWIFDGPASILREIAEEKNNKLEADATALYNKKRRMEKEKFRAQLINKFNCLGYSKDVAEKFAKTVIKNFSGLSVLDAIVSMAVERQAAHMRHELRKLRPNQHANYSPKLAETAKPYFKASGLSEEDLFQKANKHKSVASLMARKLKVAGKREKKE